MNSSTWDNRSKQSPPLQETGSRVHTVGPLNLLHKLGLLLHQQINVSGP